MIDLLWIYLCVNFAIWPIFIHFKKSFENIYNLLKWENGHFPFSLKFFQPFYCFIGNREGVREEESWNKEKAKSIKLKIHVEDNINTKCKQSSGYITQIIKNEIFNSKKGLK